MCASALTFQKSLRTLSGKSLFTLSRFPQALSHSMSSNQKNLSDSDINIENTNVKTASGVNLDEHQKVLVGSVLDVTLLLAKTYADC